MLNKILRFIVLVGIFMVPFVPLIVSGSMFFPFITGKNFAFRIIVSVIFGLWLMLAYGDKSVRPKKNWILWSILAYVGITTLATIFGQNPERSLFSNFERMEGLVTYFHLLAYFLVVSSVVNTKKLWFWFLNTSIGVSAIISIYGFVQLAGKAEIHQSGTRLDATLGNSAYLAVYALFHIFLLAYLCFSDKIKSTTLKSFYAILAVAETIILYYTATRGTILGLIGGALLVLILVSIFKPGKARQVSLGVLVGILAIVALFIGVKNTAFVKNNQVLSRFGEISLASGTVESRLLIWNMSWQGFKEHQLLGWGPENYSKVFSKYYSPKMYGQEPWFDRSHNVFFDQLINGGILGFLAYFAIFGSALYYLWRGKRSQEANVMEKGILTGLLVAYFFHNLFVFDNLISYMLYYSVLAFIASNYATEEESVAAKIANKGKSLKKDDDDPYGILVSVGATGLIIFSVYFFSLRGITVSQTLIQALSTSDASQSLDSFNKIFSYNNVVGLTEAREQLVNRSLQVISNKDFDNNLKKSYDDLVSVEMNRQLASDPNDARLAYFYGTYLANTGRYDQAVVLLEKARDLSPKKQFILFTLGNVYINTKQPDKGLAAFKQAYEEEPTFVEAKRIYILALFYTGHGTEAEAFLTGNDRSELLNDDRMLTYFTETKQLDKVAEIEKIRKEAQK